MLPRLHLLASTAVAALLVANLPATGDHIPGHDNDDPSFPVPIPGPSEFSGGGSIIFVTAIGPFGGSEITNTRFDVTFVSDGQTPATELLFNVGLLVDTGPGGVVYKEIEVDGADLGFGAGAGTFHGTFETTELNGTAVESFFFPPYSIVDLGIGATTGGVQGSAHFESSFIYFDLAGGPSTCSGDLDGDSSVGFSDLNVLLSAWGPCAACREDLNGDDNVGFTDLNGLLQRWGPCD